jgi:NADPH:quinone reductase-like Zn-dependent oxidoreductase
VQFALRRNLPAAAVGRSLVRGYITDPAGPAGLRFTDGLPEPNPADNKAIVEVKAFAINHDEANLIARRPNGWRPGQDVAGVVIKAAASGAGPAAGDRVVCYLDGEGWAERIAVPVHRMAVLGDRVSFEQAATLPIAGITALRALRVGGAVLGRKVLVTGATGGVGQFAVQLAVAAGATVTAQVSRPERVDLVRRLGACEVVTSLAEESCGPFHLVLDGVGGEITAQAIRHIAPRGHLAWYGNLGRGGIELKLADFYAQGWNAHLVGFISPDPEETLGEDMAILAPLGGGRPTGSAHRPHPRLGRNATRIRGAGRSHVAR